MQIIQLIQVVSSGKVHESRTESTRALLWTAGVWMYVVVGMAPADQIICTTAHCSHCRVIASPLGQSVTLTQALASSSSTVPTGHPHPLRHSKVQTLVGSSQVPVQGTQESTPSKCSSPCTGHSAGMVCIKYKLYDWGYSRTYYIFTSITNIRTRQRHCIVVASLGKLNGSSDHSAITSHGHI